VLEINRAAATLARRLADEYTTSDQPRFVAGSMGPSGKLPSADDPDLSDTGFDDLADVFRQQASGLIQGGAEGRVPVITDPHQQALEPGEILVCRGTDSAWTPLFLSAAGLVMEVGGMMTHGSVVTREYGIPAVVGVHEATRRLRTGMRVRIDGSSGEIQVLASDGAGEA